MFWPGPAARLENACRLQRRRGLIAVAHQPRARATEGGVAELADPGGDQ